LHQKQLEHPFNITMLVYCVLQSIVKHVWHIVFEWQHLSSLGYQPSKQH